MHVMEDILDDTKVRESGVCNPVYTDKGENYENPVSQVEHFVHQTLNGSAEMNFVLRKASNKASDALPLNTHKSLICYRRVNNVRYLNKYFEAINRSLQPGGLYIGCVETYYQLRTRLRDKYPWFISYPYLFLLFIVKRVFPKWSVTRRLFFSITHGKNRVVSLTEVLGRLKSCGFSIQSYRAIDGITWFTVKKCKAPLYEMDPTYGLLVRLKRTGKGGKEIKMLKFRTMHPYAEYLQEYAFQKSGLHNGDKVNDDFRVTFWGRILRKYWIDELPMFYNLIKGDIKLVGVRPLSAHKLGLYDKDLQELRNLHKPGLIPPYYADLP